MSRVHAGRDFLHEGRIPRDRAVDLPAHGRIARLPLPHRLLSARPLQRQRARAGVLARDHAFGNTGGRAVRERGAVAEHASLQHLRVHERSLAAGVFLSRKSGDIC